MDRLPDNVEVDIETAGNQPVAHSDHLTPADLRM